MVSKELNQKEHRAESIQWMHFAAVASGQSLRNLETTIEGRRGVLGKRLPDALADLFLAEDLDEIDKLELLVFDADDDYAWINPNAYYFVPAGDVTAELRFSAVRVWKALLGALIMASQDDAEAWFALKPGKQAFKQLINSQVFQSEKSVIVFRVIQLLVRQVPDQEPDLASSELPQLVQACKQADVEAATRLEALAWQMGDANLWRFAMAVADGKSYLAKMFEERLPADREA